MPTEHSPNYVQTRPGEWVSKRKRSTLPLRPPPHYPTKDIGKEKGIKCEACKDVLG